MLKTVVLCYMFVETLHPWLCWTRSYWPQTFVQ